MPSLRIERTERSPNSCIWIQRWVNSGGGGSWYDYSVPTNAENSILDLQQHFERYINTLPVFGFNSGKYDLNLINFYLLLCLNHERDIQPTVIKKLNEFVSFEFGDVQFFYILNFLGGATSLDSFVKAYKTRETKGFFPYEWVDSPNKLDATFLPPNECFFSKLKDHNPLGKEFTNFTRLMNSGITQQEALKKLRVIKLPHLESITTFTWNWFGRKSKCLQLEILSSGTTTKMLFQRSKRCKKWWNFTTTKESTC